MVRDGQVGFNEGGWVQPDEGATNYLGRLNQATLGPYCISTVMVLNGWRLMVDGLRAHMHTHPCIRACHYCIDDAAC